jgi:hypothetical protein
LVGAAGAALHLFTGLITSLAIDDNKVYVIIFSALLEVPLGIAVPLGTIIANYFISYFCDRLREIFVVSSCLMLAGIGGLTIFDRRGSGTFFSRGAWEYGGLWDLRYGDG